MCVLFIHTNLLLSCRNTCLVRQPGYHAESVRTMHECEELSSHFGQELKCIAVDSVRLKDLCC